MVDTITTLLVVVKVLTALAAIGCGFSLMIAKSAFGYWKIAYTLKALGMFGFIVLHSLLPSQWIFQAIFILIFLFLAFLPEGVKFFQWLKRRYF